MARPNQVFVALLVLLPLFASLLVLGDDAETLCRRIGARSGCSGCEHGDRALTCQWCVDANDDGGANPTGSLSPLCLPRGSCATAGGGGRVPALPTVCPVNHGSQKPYQGANVPLKASTTFDTDLFPNFCAFDFNYLTNTRIPAPERWNYSYPIDRSLKIASACNAVNQDAVFGIAVKIGKIADKCFNRQPDRLTERQIACLEAVQAWACTSSCPEWGVARAGYCKSGCDSIQRICAPWIGPEPCVLSALPEVFGRVCVPDDTTCEFPRRVPGSDAWAFTYGLRGKYNLPIDCVWDDWGAWNSCSYTCGTGTKSRSRVQKVVAQFDGDCFGDPTSSTTCNTQACVLTWTAWSPCSDICFGTQSRSGSYPAGAATPNPPDQTQQCSTPACPVTFGAWSSCSHPTCQGTQSRTGTYPGGLIPPVTETMDCNVGVCGFGALVHDLPGPTYDISNVISYLSGSLATYTDYFSGSAVSPRLNAAWAPRWINFGTTSTCWNSPAPFAIPGATLGANYEYYLIKAVGTITIPTTGSYNFGVTSDDGFQLDLVGPSPATTKVTMSYAGLRGPQTSNTAFNLAAGTYTATLTYYENEGGDCVAFFACPPTGNCALVGDVAHGGLVVMPVAQVPFVPPPYKVATPVYVCPRNNKLSWRFVEGQNQICSYEEAEQTFDGTRAKRGNFQTGQYSTIDIEGAGSPGQFASGIPPPIVLGGGDNYAFEFAGVLVVTGDGIYSFDVMSDDGFALVIDKDTANPLKMSFLGNRGMSHSTQAFFLAAGEHPFRLVFWECGGGDGVEFSVKSGTWNSWDSGFRLVGGGGAAVGVNPTPAGFVCP